MTPIKTTFHLEHADAENDLNRLGMEMTMMFVPQKGLLMDVDGNLRAVREVSYEPRTNTAQVWLETYESDLVHQLVLRGWKGGYRP